MGFLVAGVHNEVLGISPAMKMVGRQEELENLINGDRVGDTDLTALRKMIDDKRQERRGV